MIKAKENDNEQSSCVSENGVNNMKTIKSIRINTVTEMWADYTAINLQNLE